MKWIAETKTLELTSRNINALTMKLDDPASARMITDPDGKATAHAVEALNDPDRVFAAAAEGVVTLTRAQLVELAAEGTAITVAGFTVRSVPDAAHYGSRPAGAIVMPSEGTINGPDYTHTPSFGTSARCAAGTKILSPAAAFEAGWDYPPRMGQFGIVSPRTCGSCPMAETVWAAMMMRGVSAADLTEAQRDVVARIQGEPESITVRGLP